MVDCFVGWLVGAVERKESVLGGKIKGRDRRKGGGGGDTFFLAVEKKIRKRRRDT